MLQLPTIYTPPLSEEFVTDGDKLIEFANIAWRSPENPDGLELDEWQKWLLRAILERYPADHPTYPGRLRYRQVCISVGRQNGKSLIAAMLGLYGLLLHEVGAQCISLASSTDQANIVYNRVLYVINSNPFLKKRFKRATETRGIVTSDGGGRYDVKAAKEAALQGIPISFCLFDELHLAKEGMWSAAVLGTSQRKDGIVVGITTAGDQNSKTLIELYKSGKAAANGATDLERFGFFLWTAPENAAVDDPKAIMAANPSVAAGRIPIEQVISDLKTIPEHEARRYRLNQFIAGSTDSWLPGDIFRAATGRGATKLQNGVFAVDITRNWTHATIAFANDNDGLQETELVMSLVNPTEQQLFNEIVSLYGKFSPRAIALDDRQLPSLAKRLKLSGLPVWQLWTKEVSSACSAVFAMFSSNSVRHNNDALLVAQMPNGVAKYTGETWLISRKESLGDIDAVMSTVMALYVSSRAQHATVGVF
jgi:phage terminase large subunit-like protein